MATEQQPAPGPVAASLTRLPTWRLKGIGILRMVFGAVWAVDAWFKWQPGFIDGFSGYLTDAQQLAGQPVVVQRWIGFWINTVSVNPHVFAHGVAIAETLVAIALLFGLLSNFTYITGALLSTVIWSTAESFGGPYTAGSTDIGAAVVYVLVFAGLFLSQAGQHLGLDSHLSNRLGRWNWLASGKTRLQSQPSLEEQT